MKRVRWTRFEQETWQLDWTEKFTFGLLLLIGGTVLAAEVALQRGLACSTAGGTHHAFPSYGSGFCLLNDLAVAAKYLMNSSSRKRTVLIVDLDVHQVDFNPLSFLVIFISRSDFYLTSLFCVLRVTAPLSYLKMSHLCLHFQCIVGKISPSVNNRVTWILAWRMGWKTRSISPQACSQRHSENLECFYHPKEHIWNF